MIAILRDAWLNIWMQAPCVTFCDERCFVAVLCAIFYWVVVVVVAAAVAVVVVVVVGVVLVG